MLLLFAIYITIATAIAIADTIVIANGYWGSLSKANQFYNQSYVIKSTQKLPYLEAGVGVGNILSVLYFDCIWRVTERSKTNNISNFGVYAGTKIAF